jgi:ankyrin repeat protein
MPLHIAAFNSRLDIVLYLVGELGVDVNQHAHGGATPLCIAALNGCLGVVQSLVKKLGADVDRVDTDGCTPLYIAAESGHIDVLRCLVEDLGADVNRAIPDGATPLHAAVQEGRIDEVRCLVCKLGADVNQAKHDGFTPLMIAAAWNNQALIKHLVHKGAHVRMESTAGRTAVTVLKAAGATAAQIAYLEVRECCANPGCDGGGRKRCCVCKKMRYCGMACRVAHWRVHREGCRPPIDAGSERSGEAPGAAFDHAAA